MRAAIVCAVCVALGVPADLSAEIWERAGRGDFEIHPRASAERCVDDVRAAFDAIDLGRARGQNFYTNRIWGADTGHMQGVARLPGGWLVQSYTLGVFLTHFPSRDGSGHATWGPEPASGAPHIVPALNPVFQFHSPQVGPEGPRVDWCRDWGTSCGQPAADLFCQSRGFTASTRFEKAEGVDFVTQVLSSGERCDGAQRHCDSFEMIECVAAGAATRSHVGGVHAYDDIVVVPSDTAFGSQVELFRHQDRSLRRLARFDVSAYQPDAHYASILPLEAGEWLLAVGHDLRRRPGPHRVHFYVIPGLDAPPGALRHLGVWDRGRTRDDFQSASLVAGCDGAVFLIGTGVRIVQANAHAKLYQVLSFTRSGGRQAVASAGLLRARAPRSERNDCNLNAAATFFPTSDRALAMYCTEREIRNGQITTREYRDEDR